MTEDVMILAKTIYGEASTESLSEMEAVANVVINRLKKAHLGDTVWWGNSVKSVCLKPFQFSCWDKNHPRNVSLQQLNEKTPLFQICRRIAVRAIKGLLPDNTKGATCYHSLQTHPKWAHALVPCAQIGNRLFYTCL